MNTHEDDYSYRPINALPYWQTIGPFIEAVVNDVSRDGRTRRSVYPAVVPFVLWCWRTRGLPLERHRIFRASVAEDFVNRGMPGYLRGSRATHRAALDRVIESVGDSAPQNQRRPISRRDPTKPYTRSEVAALHSWAVAQGTNHRRIDAMMLLVLGFGAGLTAKELQGVRTEDIIRNSSGYQITVWERRPRVVPVTELWSNRLAAIERDLTPNSWAFRPGRRSNSDGQITDFLIRARTRLDVRPVRMRTTWLVEHLESGTPPTDLLRISGLKQLAALDRLTKFVPSAGVSS